MTIGIVCYPTFGGSGVIATELGKILANYGHCIHFITYERPVRLDFFVQNVYYHEVYTPNYPLFQYLPYESALISKIVDVALHYHLDFIHVHYAIPHASAAVFAKQILSSYSFHLPVVTTLHGTDITLVGKEESFKPIIQYAIENSDLVSSVSNYLKNATYDFFGVKKNIEVIPNFVSLERFRPKPEIRNIYRKLIAPNNEKILVHTSNFRKVKRVHDVLEIFLEVKKNIPCKLIMIGDGPERTNLEKFVRENHLTNCVIFMGKQEKVEDILAISDVFLMPSESESFGLAALEAMACGIPVVATNVGGLPEIVQNGFNGFMGSVGDIKKLAESVLEILNEENYTMFSVNALKTAQNFDENIIVKSYEKFYEQLIKK
jgi:N-acetyl-alpha-D-glucosaminyl L-malate synthase BshA